MLKAILTAVLTWAILPAWAQAPAHKIQKKAQPQTAAVAKARPKSAAPSSAKNRVNKILRKVVVNAQSHVPSRSLNAASARAKSMVPAALVGMGVASHLGSEELAIAERVHQGHLPCELGASVRVEPNAHQPGFFDVRGKGFHYRMHPVSTSTGAIRLEDKQAGAVWLQLANKSMLMDQKRGRRIADECAHPEQMAFAQNMKHNPPPKLFDTTGMGR